MLGLELRLYVLFWHLADRFGHVAAEGVVVPLRLTHETLGRLVAARRPSVTTALKKLAEQGLVGAREDGTWLVGGDPPAEIQRMQAVWRQHHSHAATQGSAHDV
jgi:CRP/FNR family cyclic AMP-dependent transcriptional regulator